MTPEKLDLKSAVLDGLYLFSNSDGHRHYTITEFLSYLVYPVLQNKIRFFYEDGKPVGLVTWCFLPEDIASEFLDDRYVLEEEDYIAADGDQLWGIEFIAPFGHARMMMKAMQDEHFKVYGHGRKIFWRRFKNRNSIHKGAFK